MKRKKFNSIIVKDKDSDKLVFIWFKGDQIDESYYKLSLPEGFLPDEETNGVLKSNKIILANAIIKKENDIAIIPKFCIELKIGKKPINFWHMIENPEHLVYFLSALQKKMKASIDKPE